MNSQIHESQLTELFKRAEDYASSQLKQRPAISPALFYRAAGKVSMACTPGFESEPEKLSFFDRLRLLCVAERVTAAVFVASFWSKELQPGERASADDILQDSGRKELVMISGETPGINRHMFLPIIRYGNGRFHGFGEPEFPSRLEGRFTCLVPQCEPDLVAQEIARALLALPSGKPI